MIILPCGCPASGSPACAEKHARDRERAARFLAARQAAQNCPDCRARPGIWLDIAPPIPTNPCPAHEDAKATSDEGLTALTAEIARGAVDETPEIEARIRERYGLPEPRD